MLFSVRETKGREKEREKIKSSNLNENGENMNVIGVNIDFVGSLIVSSTGRPIVAPVSSLCSFI